MSIPLWTHSHFSLAALWMRVLGKRTLNFNIFFQRLPSLLSDQKHYSELTMFSLKGHYSHNAKS